MYGCCEFWRLTQKNGILPAVDKPQRNYSNPSKIVMVEEPLSARNMTEQKLHRSFPSSYHWLAKQTRNFFGSNKFSCKSLLTESTTPQLLLLVAQILCLSLSDMKGGAQACLHWTLATCVMTVWINTAKT